MAKSATSFSDIIMPFLPYSVSPFSALSLNIKLIILSLTSGSFKRSLKNGFHLSASVLSNGPLGPVSAGGASSAVLSASSSPLLPSSLPLSPLSPSSLPFLPLSPSSGLSEYIRLELATPILYIKQTIFHIIFLHIYIKLNQHKIEPA